MGATDAMSVVGEAGEAAETAETAEALRGLAHLEAAAAGAYACALRAVDAGDRVLVGSLNALRSDHERHVATLGPWLSSTALPAEPPLPLSASTVAALKDLRGIEAVIHTAYCALERRGGLSPLLASVVRTHRRDEAQHLEFLDDVVELVAACRPS